MKPFIPALLFLLLLSLFACKKEKSESINMGYNYFPLKVANYRIYQVDSIVFNDYTTKVDSFHYQVKMLINDSFLDNTKRLTYQCQKYFRYDSAQWIFNKNMAITPTKDQLQLQDDNVRYIKLIFPVQAGDNWNFNALNTEHEKNAIYTDVDFPKSILNHRYDSCLTVVYSDEIDLVEEKVHKEIYARNVGMIYKKEVNKKLSVLRGYFVEYKLIDYGNK